MPCGVRAINCPLPGYFQIAPGSRSAGRIKRKALVSLMFPFKELQFEAIHPIPLAPSLSPSLDGQSTWINLGERRYPTGWKFMARLYRFPPPISEGQEKRQGQRIDFNRGRKTELSCSSPNVNYKSNISTRSRIQSVTQASVEMWCRLSGKLNTVMKRDCVSLLSLFCSAEEKKFARE